MFARKFIDTLHGAGLQDRPSQTEYACLVNDALRERQSGLISLLHADTGVGKSLGYLLPALSYLLEHKKRPQLIIATHSHALMDQLISREIPRVQEILGATGASHITVAALKGAANFVNPERLDLAIGSPLLILPEDRALVDELRGWTDTIASFEDAYGELPCGLRAEDICNTNGQVTDEFAQQQREAAQCDVVVTSHAMLCLDVTCRSSLFPEDRKRILIVDEADLFVDLLDTWGQKRLNLVRLRNIISRYSDTSKTSAALRKLDAIIESLRADYPNASMLWGDAVAPVVRNVLKVFGQVAKKLDCRVVADEIDTLKMQAMAQRNGIGFSFRRREPAIVAVNPYFGWRFSEYVEAFCQTAILTSGTLSAHSRDVGKGMHWVLWRLGQTKAENAILNQRIISPEHYGDLRFHLAGPSAPRLYFKEDVEDMDDVPAVFNEDWIQYVARGLAKLRAERQASEILVLTGSHKESRSLVRALRTLEGREDDSDLIVQEPGERLGSVVSRYQRSPGTVISAGGHFGLSIHDEAGRTAFKVVALTRVSFPPMNPMMAEAKHAFYKSIGKDISLKKLAEQQFYASLNMAIRKSRQGMGRVIRAEHDQADVYIFDPRFPLAQEVSRRNAWKEIIPQRFYTAYRAAEIIEQPEAAQGCGANNNLCKENEA